MCVGVMGVCGSVVCVWECCVCVGVLCVNGSDGCVWE